MYVRFCGGLRTLAGVHSLPTMRVLETELRGTFTRLRYLPGPSLDSEHTAHFVLCMLSYHETQVGPAVTPWLRLEVIMCYEMQGFFLKTVYAKLSVPTETW